VLLNYIFKNQSNTIKIPKGFNTNSMFIFNVSPLFFWTSHLLVQKNKEGCKCKWFIYS